MWNYITHNFLLLACNSSQFHLQCTRRTFCPRCYGTYFLSNQCMLSHCSFSSFSPHFFWTFFFLCLLIFGFYCSANCLFISLVHLLLGLFLVNKRSLVHYTSPFCESEWISRVYISCNKNEEWIIKLLLFTHNSS